MSAITPILTPNANGVTTNGFHTTTRKTRLAVKTVATGFGFVVYRMLSSGDWTIAYNLDSSEVGYNLGAGAIKYFDIDTLDVGEYLTVVSSNSSIPSDVVCDIKALTDATLAAIGAAANGANSDITSLNGLTTPLSTAQGGTGMAGKFRIAPMTIPVILSSAVSGATVAKVVPGVSGQIVGIDCCAIIAPTTTAKLATVQAQISGVAISGGLLSINSTNLATLGNRVAGASVSGLASYSPTQEIEVIIKDATAFVEGQILLQLFLATP